MRTLRARPVDRLETDLTQMRPLPPQVLHLGWRHRIRLPRDYYVRVDTCDYSVHPSAIGARVDVTADLDTVRVHSAGRLVAEHQRCWAKHLTITDPAHVAAAAVLRRQLHQPRRLVVEDVLVRDLADYDKAFGFDREALS